MNDTALTVPAAVPRVAPRGLRVSIGQHSAPGRKPVNQDFHGAALAGGAKGVTVALADGIGSSDVSQVAAEFAVRSLLEDYYCTSEAWSVKTAAQRVLAATNSWLHAQTRRSGADDADRGYVCTLSAVVFKSTTAHVLHVGDTRVCRRQGDTLEPLTEDHRVNIGGGRSYLARALGAGRDVEVDYRTQPLAVGDVYVLTTDGVHEHLDPREIVRALDAQADDLDAAARHIVGLAYDRGSADNLTVQIVRIDALPDPRSGELQERLAGLPHPPSLQPRVRLDGYRIERELHHSDRSHLYLATDEASGVPVVLKTLATELRQHPGAVERFVLEEWIARRIDHPHVLRAHVTTRERTQLHVAMEYIDGDTLAQWMRDHPQPGLDAVRGLIGQIAKGLQAFHRLEMVHQDLRPANVMLDASGTAKLIDFGSARVAGIEEGDAMSDAASMPGTLQYTAPELFFGEAGTPESDVFSLGVIAYEMLTGRLPYGAQVARQRSMADALRLVYRSARDDDRGIPAWVDDALRQAVHPDPRKRYAEPSEFVHDLCHPNRAFLSRTRTPWVERHPVRFWKGVSLVLAVSLFGALAVLLGR